MYREKKAQKQTLSLKNFQRLASHNPQAFSLQKHRIKLRPSSLLVGLTATLGITSIALAATQQNVHIKSNQINKAPESSSAPLNNKTSTDVTIESSNSSDGTNQSNDAAGAESVTQTNGSNAQVTINNESIPVNNGTVQRTFTDSNGSTYSVTINVDSNSTSNSSSRSHTDIDIKTSGNTSVNNTTRGSPNQ